MYLQAELKFRLLTRQPIVISRFFHFFTLKCKNFFLKKTLSKKNQRNTLFHTYIFNSPLSYERAAGIFQWKTLEFIAIHFWRSGYGSLVCQLGKFLKMFKNFIDTLHVRAQSVIQTALQKVNTSMPVSKVIK